MEQIATWSKLHSNVTLPAARHYVQDTLVYTGFIREVQLHVVYHTASPSFVI